jgi:transcriptional regulator with XRE-family HTH domain
MSENLIAKRMGILPEVYSKLESGTITATKEDVEKLSEILNYPVSFFYQEYTPMELDGNCWSTHQLKEKAIIDQYVPKEVQDRFDALIKRDIKRKREIMWLD